MPPRGLRSLRNMTNSTSTTTKTTITMPTVPRDPMACQNPGPPCFPVSWVSALLPRLSGETGQAADLLISCLYGRGSAASAPQGVGRRAGLGGVRVGG